jgi:hypothetical protein
LHFHGFIELPRGWTRSSFERLLERVFGKARPMGKRQFHFSPPRWDQHYTFNDVQVTGPLGKLVYALAHAGTTYHNLGLNDGKRSRSCPAARGNFNSAIVFVDSLSKRAGKEAFDAWVKAERALRQPSKQASSPPAETSQAAKRRASA